VDARVRTTQEGGRPMMNAEPQHPELNVALSDAAQAADDHYSATIKRLTGRTRWTMKPEDNAVAEIRAALDAKLAADKAWIAEMRRVRALIDAKEVQ
jgi:hypothetical protein